MVDEDIFLIIIIFGIGLILRGGRNAIRLRRMQFSAGNNLAQATAGKIKIEGYAWPKEKIWTSTSGLTCAYYKCDLESEGNGDVTGIWTKVQTYAPCSSFIILDKNGMALVDLAESEIECTTAILPWSSAANTEIGKTLAAEAKNFETQTADISPKEYRIIETYITLGSPCLLVGYYLVAKKAYASFNSQPAKEFIELINSSNFNLSPSANLGIRVTAFDQGPLKQSLHQAAATILTKNVEKPPVNSFIKGLVTCERYQKLLVFDSHEKDVKLGPGKNNIYMILAGVFTIAIMAYIRSTFRH